MSKQKDTSTPSESRPPAWKRALLIALLAVLFWLALHLRPQRQPKVIYASRCVYPRTPKTTLMLSRYSKEFKYRPAASPVITERLKDGTIRLRGALPT